MAAEAFHNLKTTDFNEWDMANNGKFQHPQDVFQESLHEYVIFAEYNPNKRLKTSMFTKFMDESALWYLQYHRAIQQGKKNPLTAGVIILFEAGWYGQDHPHW